MSCSPEDHKMLSATSRCEDLPVEPNKGKIRAIVDRVNNEMFVGLTEEQCKVVVLGAVRESSFVHLHHLTVDDIVLVSPEHVKEEMIQRQKSQHAVVMRLIKDQHAQCVRATEVVLKELKTYQPKQYEPLKPDPAELRYRNEQYRQRQRFHNRGAR